MEFTYSILNEGVEIHSLILIENNQTPLSLLI
jgi:hypothetical protein